MRVFVSYSRTDTRAVKGLVDRLRDLYYDVWFDVDTIPGGADWRQEIERGIERADAILLMLSPDSCASEFVLEEVELAHSKSRKIIPLLIRPFDTSGKMKESDYLAQLKVGHLNYIKFTDADDRMAWERLLDPKTLPLPIRTAKWVLDPEAQARHRAYLRTLQDRYGKVPLMGNGSRQRADLFEVYVPLKLGVSFNIEVQSGEMVDWWLRDQDVPRIPLEDAREKFGEQFQPKALNGFSPQGTVLPAWVERLEDAWQQLKQSHDEKESEKPEDKREALPDGTYYWNRIESETAAALMPRLVITGDPGSGKSTLMRHLALCMAEDLYYEGDEDADGVGLNRLGFWRPLPAFTPVFVELRALVREQFRDERDEVTLEGFMAHLESQMKPYGCTGFLPDLKMLLEEGSAMIFLDGLDEVPDAGSSERRKQIQRLVELLTASYPDCRILITSRPYAYAGDWRLEGFGEVKMAYLDPDRLEELALKLFHVVLGDGNGEAEAEQFKARVEQLDESIRRNPLFFTLLAQLWLNNRAKPDPDDRLPMTPGAIYYACVEQMLARWTRKDLDQEESLADLVSLTEGELRLVLQELAYTVHAGRSGNSQDPAEFTAGDIMNAVKQVKKKGVDYDTLNEHLAQRAGVLYEFDPTGRYRFAHLSFEEHLAAAYLARVAYPERILTHIQDEPLKWRNVADLLPDEVLRNKGDLWQPIERAVGSDVPEELPVVDDKVWQTVAYAAKVICNHLDDETGPIARVMREQARHWLAGLISVGALAAIERAEAGRYLALLGDPRPGIGLPKGGPEQDPDYWVEIPGGAFLMGSDKTQDKQASDDETPQHWFELDTYYIARYPVTVAQYEAFVAGDGYTNNDYWTAAGLEWRGEEQQPHYWNDSRWHISNHPVVGVTWYEAHAFCQWLSEKLGTEIRLPTEAEWEKAARGTDGLIYPYSNEFDPAKGNTSATGIGKTSAVGMFPDGAAPDGVLDMSGNVWEWCATEWGWKYKDGLGAMNNEPEGSPPRVLRGGSCFSYQFSARAASRYWSLPYYRDYDLGFRVCCLLRPPSL